MKVATPYCLIGVAAVALMIGTARSAQAGYVNEVLADGPVAYWRLNEAVGATQFQPQAGYGTVPLDAIDGTGASHGGVNDSPPTAGEPGPGPAPWFGTGWGNKSVFLPNEGPAPNPRRWGDYLLTNSPTIDLTGTGNFSMELWFKHKGPNLGSSSTAERIIGNADAGWNSDRYMFELESSTIRYNLSGGMSSNFYAGHNLTFAENEPWHHLVFTKDGGTGHVYLDGVDLPVSSGSNSVSGAVSSTAEPFAFGNDRNFKGRIDEIAMYNRALSAADIQRHYRAALGTPLPEVLALAVDFGVEGGSNAVQDGWEDFSVAQTTLAGPLSETFGSHTVTLTSGRPDGVFQFRDRGDVSPFSLGDVVEDQAGVEDNDIILTIEGLAAGEYMMTTFSHDAIYGAIGRDMHSVTVDDADGSRVVATGVEITKGADPFLGNSNAPRAVPSMLTFTLSSNGGPITITFDGSPAGGISTNLNGFYILPIPEPSSVVLLGLGLVSLVGCCWRHRRRP